jgi:hypothetical protein
VAYEGTSVLVSKSQEDIRRLLQKHGASQFTFGEGTVEGRVFVAVEFVIGNFRVRMKVPLKMQKEDVLATKARRARSKTLGEIRAEANEQEARRIWRVIHWALKARLEAVEEEVETLEQAFLSHLVLDNGTTVYESLVHTGRVDLGDNMPLALPPGHE